jgi:hypothetical protein
VFDKLLERLEGEVPPAEGDWLRSPYRTFHIPLFRFWARLSLNLEPGFDPLSDEQLRRLFEWLRDAGEDPPYHMDRRRDAFVEVFASQAVGLDPDRAACLDQALRVLWQEFDEEYRWVPAAELGAKFATFF